jgi:hypothetical protein
LRRGQFGYGWLSLFRPTARSGRNLQGGIPALEELGSDGGSNGRKAQRNQELRNQEQQRGQTPWLSSDKATTQLTHGVFPLKCVLRLIRSDLAASGVVPPDNRVGYQACTHIIGISGTILETHLTHFLYPDSRARKTCTTGISGPDFDGG